MSFSMSPFPLRFGSRQGGGASGDQTAITPANADTYFTALGAAQAGTGTTWGETGQAATPLYAVAAGKVPLGYDAELGVFGPIVNPAGTNLTLHDRDAAQTAWVKSNMTAALALGGLEHDADWRGPELVVNGSFASGGAGWAQTGSSWTFSDGVAKILVAGTPSTLSQTIGSAKKAYILEISVTATIGTLAISLGGTAIADVGSGSHQYLRIYGSSHSELRITNNAGFSGSIDNVSLQEVDAHTLLTATSNNATALQAITSSSNPRVSRLWLARANGSGTISLTQDNGSTWADVTPGADPLPFDVAAATLANPTMGIRLATSGDSVRLYGVPHQVAARPLRPYIGPTAGSTVTTGARTMICTLSESPSLVSLKLRFRTPTVNVAGQTVFSVDDNAATNLIDLKANGSGGFVLRKVIASSETAFPPFAVAVNTLVQVDVEISASVFRYRIDGGSWVNGTAGIPGSLSRFRTGHDNANAGQLGQPILALDELSTAAMMDGLRGWNKESLV